MPYPALTRAPWPLALPPALSADEVNALRREVDRRAAASQYGWGHTIDFGPFAQPGLLGEDFLDIAGTFDAWGWWPARLDGLKIADVGCFTGGLAALMAHRGAEIVYAIDEVPAHLAQCKLVASAFQLPAIRTVASSLYRLREAIAPGSLDVIVLSGVLYHLSDMLVGLHALRELLKPDGLLLMQSNGVDEFRSSYANFGRFFAGIWWQPTGLCIQDMCTFMGYAGCEVRFYAPTFCLARARRAEGEIPFRRGLNWTFDDVRDRVERSLDPRIMAPAPRLPPAT